MDNNRNEIDQLHKEHKEHHSDHIEKKTPVLLHRQITIQHQYHQNIKAKVSATIEEYSACNLNKKFTNKTP